MIPFPRHIAFYFFLFQWILLFSLTITLPITQCSIHFILNINFCVNNDQRNLGHNSKFLSIRIHHSFFWNNLYFSLGSYQSLHNFLSFTIFSISIFYAIFSILHLQCCFLPSLSWPSFLFHLLCDFLLKFWLHPNLTIRFNFIL